MIRPRLSFKEIYGDAVYCPRASPHSSRWLSLDPVLLNARTGSPLCVVDDMPVLCSRGAATSDGLKLLTDAGFQPTPNRYTFSGDDEYYGELGRLARSGQRMIVVHAHAPGEVADEAAVVVPRDLLVYLNNKANLGDLVPREATPKRRVIYAEDIAAAAWTIDLPMVLKAGTDESTGGGDDVRICHSREDVLRAVPVFQGIERIVAEELLEIVRNLCLSYAVMSDGTVRYLGSSEQVSAADGLYYGNWIDDESVAPEAAVKLGASVAARGAARGYRGICGLDVAILPDGRVIAFDLNFRTNGSTAPVLLRESIERERGARVLRLNGWQRPGSYRDLLNATYEAVDAGYLLPLLTYDPQVDGFADGLPRLTGLLLGATREEIPERERQLGELGFE